jgi:hypothetical protein
MTLIPTWVTPAGTLGTIPEGVFYSVPLEATSDSTVRYRVIAGRLPPGVQINETGVLAGNPSSGTVQGVPSDITNDTTSQFVVRAYTQRVIAGQTVIDTLADRTFSLTIVGQSSVVWTTPAGTIGTYVDGVQVADLQVQYTDTDIFAVNVVSLIAGGLPPGMTISPEGVISGYITPNTALSPPAGYDLTPYDQYPFDFPQQSTDTVYQFTLKVDNGTTSDVREFNIVVYARSLLTADNTTVTADNTFLTADLSPVAPPIIITPTGSIGTTRSDNFYAFEFIGLNFSGTAFEFIALTALPPGLALDSETGWLSGYIPFGGVLSAEYPFELIVREVNTPSNRSDPYAFSLTIAGPVDADVVWITPDDTVERAKDPSSLGLIDNGATSTFYVKAVNVSGIPLQYRLVSGSNSRLPQGLQLLPSGNIAGRVSFDTFTVDGGTTTFDVGLNTVDQPTTFDLVAVFTVTAFSTNGLVNVSKTFSITVVRRYEQPYDNLYIQAMPPQDDRDVLAGLLQDPTIFPPALIYRQDDPNFGVARRAIYNHAYGLRAATLNSYVSSLNLNHYWKNLLLGQIQTARALDNAGNIIYEVVYSQVVDNLVNNEGLSVDKQVVLPFPIDANTPQQIDSVYPNSLDNMRDQVIDTVGQVSNVLPRWMLSTQSDGRVLGFTPAWVIAYTNPGQSGQIAYNIQTQFASHLNMIDFKADRYELDNFLTKNWNRESQHWGYYDIAQTPYPPSLTTFDFIGLPPFDPTRSYAPGDTVIYQVVVFEPAPNDDIPAYRTNRLYVCTQTTTPGILPTNSNYWSDKGNNLASWINDADVITTWEDNFNTLATWTYATPPGTTFDGGSLQFTAPVDMYSSNNTTEYDKYLLFPKINILE